MKNRKQLFFHFFSFFAFFLFSVCFSSCEFFNQPVREYLEYWTSTCQVGKMEYASEYTYFDDVPQVSANGTLEIRLYLVNPKGIPILKNPDTNKKCFSFAVENGESPGTNYSEEAMDADQTSVRIKIKLDDRNEGQKITLSGCLWPENKTQFEESQLKKSYPETFYSTTFVQNTPPDNIKDLQRAPDFFPETKKAYISFKVPKQDQCRNKNSTYEVKYYFREDNGSMSYKGSRILTLADNKNPDSGRDTFMYYFEEQTDDILNRYEYTVQETGPHGLKAELRATDKALGPCILVEPVVTVNNEFNGLKDEDDYLCIEVPSNDSTVSFTAIPGQEGDTLTVTDNGTVMVPTGNLYTVSGIGQHQIIATSSRTDAFPVTVEKKIRIVKTPSAASIVLGTPFNGKGQDTSGYWYIEVNNASDKVNYTISPTEEGTTLSGTIDSTTFSETDTSKTGTLDVSSHTLTGVIHKQYCKDVSVTKKVKVVRKLQAPSCSFSPGKTGTKTGDFEWIEVPDGSTYVTYTITAASGCTMEIKNSYGNSTTTVNTHTYTNNLASLGAASSRDYTLTITVKKPYQNDQTFYKYIKMVRKLQKPAFTYYKNSGHTVLASKDDNADTSEMIRQAYADNTYGIELKDYGETMYYVASLGTGESLTIEDKSHDDESLDSPEGTLTLGYHRLRLLVSREGYQTQEYEELVYVQGILANPVINYVNKSKLVSASDKDTVYFSFLSNNKLYYTVSAGNDGNKLVVKKGTHTESPNAQKQYALMPDTTNSLSITQTRDFCKPNVYARTVEVKIKPITLSYNNNDDGTGRLYVYLSGFNKNKFDLKGKILVNENEAFSYIHSNRDNVKQNEWHELGDSGNPSFTITCSSTKDELKIAVASLRRNVGNATDDPDNDGIAGSCTKTFSTLTKDESNPSLWVLESDEISEKNRSIKIKILFMVSD